MISTYLALALVASPLQVPTDTVTIPSLGVADVVTTQVATDSTLPSNDFVDLPVYQQDIYSFEVTPGGGSVGIRWGDRARAVWGSSYATSTWDSLGLNDPKTLFNISTVRISPTIF